MAGFLIVEPFSSHFSGAQKVTNIIAKFIGQNSDRTILLARKSADNILSHYKEFNAQYFPFENSLSKIFGSGNFDSQSFFFKLVTAVKYFWVLLLTNIYVLFLCKKNKIDSVYCYDPRGLILCFLFLRLFNIKLIWHLHGELSFSKGIQRLLSKFISITIVPSRYIKNSISPAFHAHVLYNGFDFPVANQFDKFAGSLNLLYVGAITPQKGLHFLLDSLCYFENDSFKVNVRVVGDSVGDNTYSAWVKKNAINSMPNNVSVEFLGWRSDVFKLYELSDVTCFTSLDKGTLEFEGHKLSYRSSEALPTVPIESIAMGTPVVAMDIAGTPEIISTGVGILLPNSTTPKEFYEALKSISSIGRVSSEFIFHHKLKFCKNKMLEEFSALIF